MKTTDLYQIIERFHIRVSSGVNFWAPYINNLDFTQREHVIHGLGKSSAKEILRAASLAHRLEPSLNSEELKTNLVNGHFNSPDIDYKGIDCSGFVYHVLNDYLTEEYDDSLAKYVSLPKNHVLNGAYNLKDWANVYTLSKEEAFSLPDDVPVQWVVEHFKRKPENLCGARGLVSEYSAIKIMSIHEVEPGDTVFMSSDKNTVPHIALILENKHSELVIAHSTRKDPSDPGGVIIERLPVKFDVADTSGMYSPHTIESFHRSRALIR